MFEPNLMDFPWRFLEKVQKVTTTECWSSVVVGTDS